MKVSNIEPHREKILSSGQNGNEKWLFFSLCSKGESLHVFSMVSAYFHQSLKSLDSRRERVYNHNSFTIKELNVCNSNSQKSYVRRMVLRQGACELMSISHILL